MLTNSLTMINRNAVRVPVGSRAAFFVSPLRKSSKRCCCSSYPWGRSNFSAMIDQNFQEMMNSSIDPLLSHDGPSNVSEQTSSYPVGEAKPSIVEELESQISFKQFLKRNIVNRKPSPALIQSIKDRIILIDSKADSAI